MVVIICTLLAVIVKWSNAEMNLKEFNVKGVHRSLLQSIATNEPAQHPTILHAGDLTTCDSSLEISLPEEPVRWYFSISGSSIIGIDACDYDQGNNDFYFGMYLEREKEPGFPYKRASAGNTPSRCTYNGEGAYIEGAGIGTRLYVGVGNTSNATLKLTPKCETKTTTPAPTSVEGIIGCNDRVTGVMGPIPLFYELILQDPMNVNFQDCETRHDGYYLYIYNKETGEQMNSCSDDCGNCTKWRWMDGDPPAHMYRAEFTLYLAAGSYYVKIDVPRQVRMEYLVGTEYVIVTTCEEATGSPTTHEPRRPVGGFSCYSVMVSVVVVLIGALFG